MRAVGGLMRTSGGSHPEGGPVKHPIEIMREMSLTDIDHPLTTTRRVRHSPCGVAKTRASNRRKNRIARASRRKNR